jgi:hypothetical protein
MGQFLWSGVSARPWNVAEEFDDGLAKGLDAPSEGIMIFTLEPLMSDEAKQNVVRARFR